MERRSPRRWPEDGKCDDGHRACLTKQPTLTRQLDRLCAAGLTERENASRDRRGVIVKLTDIGRRDAETYVSWAERHETEVLLDYTSSEIAALKATLIDLASRARTP